jgi:uncharacterized protein (TIGR01777 family)
MDVVIGGSSGLVGQALTSQLSVTGHRPIRLVRRDAVPGADEISWDPTTGQLDAASIEGVDAVVHLGGAGIGDRRWSGKRKAEIYKSRIDSTSLLASTLAGLERPPSAFLGGSAIGIYGERGDEILDETSSLGSGFLADLCKDWEAATSSAAEAEIRTINLRTGIVLSPEGPFLKRQLPLFKLGLGGRLGSADRWVSWISIDDIAAAIVWLLESELAGPVNLTAPAPVRNIEMVKTLGEVLHRPTVLPVPTFAPSALFGRELVDALLESTRVTPGALTSGGYQFIHSDVETALRDVLGRDRETA